MGPPTEIAAIDGWHAHVYFDPTTRERAAQLREWIGARFEVTLGRWHEGKVGPHPQAMYQVAFSNAAFPTLVPFIALNRLGLTVLIHPNTRRERDDHLVHAMWLGAVLPLDASMLVNHED
ncbi:MAG: DOPA 4,5-dioxygenase family protein [Rhodospirillales bacterium]|nr:DOPA 4,5-dioxygenase family protein [Rhodospirillales bacterium]MDE2575065.1 DOPA 4,5-dioxygenase family protein [Rhodospirillales bacterium]